MAIRSFFGKQGIGRNGSRTFFLKRNFFFDDVTKNKGFLKNDLKTHIGRVPDAEFFSLTIGTWLGFSFFLLLVKTTKLYAYINAIRVKNKNCEFLQNLSTDFLVACQLKILRCLLCLHINKENSPCRNLETPSRSQLGSKNKPSISISSCHGTNIWVPMKSNAVGFYYWPSTECYVISICQPKKNIYPDVIFKSL